MRATHSTVGCDAAVMTQAGPLPSAAQWRLFVRALAEEVQTLAGEHGLNNLLRATGWRMANLLPLPPVETLHALELEANDALSLLGLGSVTLRLELGEPALLITHTDLPRIGSLGTPAGTWLSPMLEGLYDEWFAKQPGAQVHLSSRRIDTQLSIVVLKYGRHVPAPC